LARRKNKHQQIPADYTPNNRVNLIRGGKAYFDQLLELIEQAKDSIHLQVYIYSEDETGNTITHALLEAVKRNVKVYLLVDGYASQSLTSAFVHKLEVGGVYFRFFEPIFKSRGFYFGRRLHHKLVVIDSTYALVGGLNIADKYNDLPGQQAWLDFALMVEGEVVRQLCILCWKTWNRFPARLGPAPCETVPVSPHGKSEESSWVRMRRNDWVRNKSQVSRTYLRMFSGASDHMIVLSSYFLPGNLFRKRIKKAVRRGVKIKIITAGLSDVMLAKNAERFWYDWLLRNNIQIYEYQKSILHGKLAVCDGKWLTLGSYNVNNISAYASVELNLDVLNEAFAAETEKLLLSIIEKDCVQITAEQLHKKNTWLKKLVHWGSYEFIRILFFLFTFYFRQKE